MHIRLSRLRFVLVRASLLLLAVLFVFEIRLIFRDRTIVSATTPLEASFWRRLSQQDQLVFVEQKLTHIESAEKQRARLELNWTSIFYTIYRQKEAKLREKDAANSNSRQRTNESSTLSAQSIFEIYEETPVFQQPKFCTSKVIFHAQCPFTNCRWKCENPSTGGQNTRRARIFHHVDINADDMRAKTKTRSSTDIWILWIDEANRPLQQLNEYHFNWTLTFRQDAEVSLGAYGLLAPAESSPSVHSTNVSDLILSPDFLYILANRNVLVTDFAFENTILTNFRYRSKHALWFVSNCEPQARLKYYTQLKAHFPIRAFGACVDNAEKPCQKNDGCEIEHSRLAFFYLAFESQTCTDYITEKFWRALHHGMIPVVLGPSKQSYLDLGVPESAFIHVDDFYSARHLGEYLHRVANDYFLYRTYFQWISQFHVVYRTEELEPIRMCELCMRLNLQNSREHRFYTDVHQWHRAGC